ncbi:MAG: ornithine cyclodeaminase [Chloroflexi bacterium]|nr:ornithine cyclodeaminase [Chloroflexota bacterium]|tara:strand:+ start:7879 stop:8808 length:930 start_codon:yes stop_codon:yes gene_type:complete
MTIYIKEKNVQEILDVKTTIDLLEEAMKSLSTGKGFNSPRKRLPTSYSGGNLHFMAASWPEKGIAGHKSYVVTKGKATFVVLLYSTEGEGLLAIIEANLLGQIRTGAASGLASKYLANKSSKKLAIIGSGFQALTQIEAINSQFNLEQINVYSKTKENRENFSNKMSKKLNIEVKSFDSSEEATEDCDIISLITNSSIPVITEKQINSGIHINAAGGNSWLRSEISSNALNKFDFVSCDDLEQAKTECKELMEATEKGIISWNNVNELSSVIDGKITGRKKSQDITLYESLGIAIQDIAAAKYLYDQLK